MNPTDVEIESAIEREIVRTVGPLPPGPFERLAASYAQLAYPERFRELVPISGNHWCDAYVQLPDGRIDVLEFTHRKADWEAHLKEKLDHAEGLGPGRLAGFFYVSWCPEPGPEALKPYYDRCRHLGIAEEKTAFVFRKRLVRELGDRRFARLWTEILNLPCHCHPFEPIRGTRCCQPGRPGTDFRSFVPTREEYDQGLVHRPAIAAAVEEQLQRRGWALVRGRPGSGKTVLATSIALGLCFGAAPAYYLDLADDPEVGPALDAIVGRGAQGVLFILDNVHLDEEFARKVFEHWSSFPQGSSLLMTGRHVTAPPDPRGWPRPLEHLGSPEPFEPTAHDLGGVLRRLMARAMPPAITPQPPPAVLAAWHRTFGADLIAFSAAVAQQVEDLRAGDWNLRVSSADQYVERAYFQDATPEERRDLLLLSAMADIELNTPQEALESGGLLRHVADGRVERLERGRERYVQFRLPHPGWGGLLRSAARSTAPPLDALVRVALANPSRGFLAAARFDAAGRSDERDAVLASLAGLPGGVARALLASGTVAYFRVNLERLAKWEIRSEEQIDAELAAPAPGLPPDAQNAAILGKAALRTPLEFLASFLAYAETRLPRANKGLREFLEQPENVKVLGEAALRTPLANLVSFLDSVAFAEKVVAAVDRDGWEQARAAVREYDPGLFLRAARAFERLGRPDLAEAPAEAFVRGAQRSHWDATTCGIVHLSYILRLGHRAGTEAILGFLERILSASWLRDQYASCEPGPLAGAMFALWGFQDEAVLNRFRTAALRGNLQRHLRGLARPADDAIFGTLQLLGCCRLLAIDTTCTGVLWPTSGRLRRVLELAAPAPGATAIGHVQVQFWLGLREMARLRSDRVGVPAEAGEQVRGLWRVSAPPSDRHAAFNAWMLDWLDRCSQAGWVLLADEVPMARAWQES